MSRGGAKAGTDSKPATDGGLAESGATVQGTLGKLDRSLANLEMVTQQLKDGKGVAPSQLKEPY